MPRLARDEDVNGVADQAVATVYRESRTRCMNDNYNLAHKV